MKKLLLILSIFLVFTSCIDEVIEQVPPPDIIKTSVFDVKESRVIDGQDIYFTLSSAGLYTLTLIDKETNQVISRERFNGTIGENTKKIYTNSIQSRYLYLLLEDVTKKEIGRTTIITK
jgi:hypothetical protein